MIAERHFKNEDVIKDMITDGHRRGVCDKNGETKPDFTSVFIATDLYRENYNKIDWT